MGEVDQFLDEVEVELTRLHQENDDLRSKLGDPSAATPADAATAPATAEETPAVAAASVSLPPVRTIAEASGAAARLLEIAAQNADQLVSEAHGDADKIVGEATVKAERLESESKSAAERLEAEAKERAEQQAAELDQRRQETLGALERDKDSLATELEDLRSFEREYRSRLRAYFENQLRTLDGEGGEADVPLAPSADGSTATPADESAANGAGPAPGRLQELLGEDAEK
jgi:cell division septum initiation protein DivIVA